MDYRDGPSADVPILLFLICATVILGVFASTVVWLNRPTVIAASASTEYKGPRQAQVTLLTSGALAQELEERATVVAEKANAELGLRKTQVAHHDPAPERVAKQAEARPAAVKKPKPKPRLAARKPSRDRERDYAHRRPQYHEWRSFGSAWFGHPGLFFN